MPNTAIEREAVEHIGEQTPLTDRDCRDILESIGWFDGHVVTLRFEPEQFDVFQAAWPGDITPEEFVTEMCRERLGA